MISAVISLSGKQHLVSEGDKIVTDSHVGEKVGATVSTDVLMLLDDDKPTIGNPTVKGASVSLEVLELGKAAKVITAKYQAKTRYHRRVGHRQPTTTLKVTKISSK